MRVLLVHLSSDRREMRFPLELAAAAAVLKAGGHEANGFDFGVHSRRAWPAVTDGVDAILWQSDCAGWTPAQARLRELRPNDRRLVVLAGPQATLFPDEVLAGSGVDVAVLGEIELVVGQVIEAWQQGRHGPIPGVVWQRRWTDRGFVSRRQPKRIDCLGELPLPDRTVFPLDRYTGMATRRARYTQIVTSRGSDHADAHSPLPRLLPGARRTRPLPQVLDEIRALRARFGIEEFHVEDEGFFEDRPRVLEFCAAVRSEVPGVLWQCANGNRADDLDPDLLDPLAAAGCYRVYLQLDSPDPAAMALLGRRWDPGRIASLAAAACRVGIELGGYFTLGLPGETPPQMEQTVRFALDCGLAWAQFTPFALRPGSELWQRRDQLAGLLPPEPQLRSILRRAYWRFYSSRGRWRVVLRNVHRRNARQILWRACDKLLRGRP